MWWRLRDLRKGLLIFLLNAPFRVREAQLDDYEECRASISQIFLACSMILESSCGIHRAPNAKALAWLIGRLSREQEFKCWAR